MFLLMLRVCAWTAVSAVAYIQPCCSSSFIISLQCIAVNKQTVTFLNVFYWKLSPGVCEIRTGESQQLIYTVVYTKGTNLFKSLTSS